MPPTRRQSIDNNAEKLASDLPGENNMEVDTNTNLKRESSETLVGENKRPRTRASIRNELTPNVVEGTQGNYESLPVSETQSDESTDADIVPTPSSSLRVIETPMDDNDTDDESSPVKRTHYNRKYNSNPFNRPISRILTRTGESFLQDASCIILTPNLVNCRECKIGNLTTADGNNEIICRFYGFRKLKYSKSGLIRSVGFSDAMVDPKEEDLNLWLPNPSILPHETLDATLAKVILEQLGDQFCELVKQEVGALDIQKQAKIHANAFDSNIPSEEENSTRTTSVAVAWKRVVKGIRELCDVCDTTLFNYHWACKKCGFVACIDCVKGKDSGKDVAKVPTALTVPGCGLGPDKDPFNWLYCTISKQHKYSHNIDELMLTQIIPKDALMTLGKLVHFIRNKYKLPQKCNCDYNEEEFVGSDEFNKFIKQEFEPEEDMKAKEVVVVEKVSTNLGTGQGQVQTAPLARKKLLLDSDSSDDEDDALRLLFQKAPRPAKPIQKLITNPIPLAKTPHTYLCGGKLLHLLHPNSEGNFHLFTQVWKHGHPVLVSDVSTKLDPGLWSPQSFLEDFGQYKNDLVNCLTGKIVSNQPMSHFWNGFLKMSDRLKDCEGRPMLLKLKDWPPGNDFSESLPSRFMNLMDNLPLPEYARRDGRLNLTSLLPDKFMKPDLGPKMYIAYGSAFHLNKATTNLHLDISDAVNLMVHVGMCEDMSPEDKAEQEKALKEALDNSDCDGFMLDRLENSDQQPGALWHIYNAKDADKIRDLLNRINVEKGKPPAPNHDPIHDQTWYLDRDLRRRLIDEYNVVGYPIIQFMGDAVFIPAGAPHQVRNLQNCIKVAEDFVSPEHVQHCFELTQEFRNLSKKHSNHEDKLQIKNIIYHAVKEAVSVLSMNKNKKSE